jgi:hypothetical protein
MVSIACMNISTYCPQFILLSVNMAKNWKFLEAMWNLSPLFYALMERETSNSALNHFRQNFIATKKVFNNIINDLLQI